jgi:hypothetical protein
MSENNLNYQPEDFDRLLLAARGRALQALEVVTASKDERNALRAIMIIFRVAFPTDPPELSTPGEFAEYKNIFNKARYVALVRADKLSTTSADEVVKTRASQAIIRLQTSEERLLRGQKKQGRAVKVALPAVQSSKKSAGVSQRTDIGFNEAVDEYIRIESPSEMDLYAKELERKFGYSFAKKVVRRARTILLKQEAEKYE